ncbi:MAG: sulfite exporter TauE/SafE family protein, partial [Chloroflexota bacterium]|nr:sulfite exporter TauE/SafE family protein [Chloroflexota bacterium]
HGRVDWRMALLTSVGSALSGPLGAAVSVSLPQAAVKLVFALFLLVVGVNALFPRLLTRTAGPPRARPDRLGIPVLLACGLVVGFGSGLVGVGGPAILVPLLVLLGLPVPTAVGVSQVNQVVASASGAVGHLAFGGVDLVLAGALTVFEVVGVCVGALLSRRVSANGLKVVVGLLCLVVAVWTLAGLLN